MMEKLYSAKLLNSSVRVIGTYEPTSICDGVNYYDIHLMVDTNKPEIAYEIDPETLEEIKDEKSKCA